MYGRSNNEISHKGPRDVGPLKATAADAAYVYENLDKLGVGFDARDIDAMFHAYQSGNVDMLNAGMDADLIAPLTTPSISTPIQFLQEWLPGFVFIITQARKIDDLVGITTQGRWEDEEVVQGTLERTGASKVYGDLTNIPLSGWNTNFERRTVIRFEEGMTVGRLEERRAAAMRLSSAESKRSAAAEALEITRNFTGFNGYNDGANRTFGILNDPDLPSYISSVGGVWSGLAFLAIVANIRLLYATLRTQSGGRIDPGNDPVTMGIALSVYDQLSVTSDFGNSVLQWLNATYPNTRIIPVPEFDNGNGSAEVLYLYAEGVSDESTDDRRTWVQVVPSKFQSLGVEQRAKGYVEDYSNATAGVFLKRPYAVVRMTGI